MLSNWIWPVTPANWPIVKSKKVWAVDTVGKGSRVVKGDKIIFYVNGTRYFQGIFEVITDWHQPTVKWTVPTRDENSAAEIDLKEIQTGFASLKKLIDSLEFIESRKNVGLYLRGTPHGPANSAKPVSDHDYVLILEELKKVQERPIEEESKDDIDVEEFVQVPSWDFINERIHELPPANLKSVSSIIADVQNGRYAIPIFQREFTWNRRQVEELWESIFQGFFVGSVLTWNKTGQFHTIPVYGAPDLSTNTEIVLDGQQRITSLYYAVAAPEVNLTDTKTIRFFVDLKSLLDPRASSTDVVVSYYTEIAKKRGYLTKETQFSKKLFPITEFNNRDYGIWMNEFKAYLKDVEGISEKEADNYYRQIMNVLDHVWFQYKIPVVQLPTSMTLDSVAEIFEKINSKGTLLGVFDLLNARFTRYDVNLRSLWDESKANYENIDQMNMEIGKDSQKFMLQALCLHKKGYCRRRELLSLDSSYTELGQFQKEYFEEDWGKISEYVSKTIDKLMSQRESGFGAVKFGIIPYTVTIPVIAALFYKIANREDRPKCMNKIETWYWSVVLSDSYSSSTDSKIEKDFREIQQWFDDDSLIPEMVLEQKRRFDEMNFATTRPNDSIYKLVMCLVSKKGAYDFLTHEPPEYSKLDDHHIFPRSREKEYAGNTSINSILNRTLLDSETNRKFIRNQNPSDYLKEIMEKQGIQELTLRKRLATHLIPSDAFDCLLCNDYDGFIEARRNAVRNECRKLIFPAIQEESDILKLLNKKEDKKLEYKASLRWDVNLNQQNPALEEIIAKELCCFMNSGGGNLLVGVDDSGKPIGLEKDYSTFKDNSSDGFSQHLINMVNKYLDRNANVYFETTFHKIDGKEICLCKIKSAPRPVYLTKNNEKRFFVRMDNTCQPLDMEEAHKYISEHWR